MPTSSGSSEYYEYESDGDSEASEESYYTYETDEEATPKGVKQLHSMGARARKREYPRVQSRKPPAPKRAPALPLKGTAKRPVSARSRRARLRVNVRNTKYSVVRRSATELGWAVTRRKEWNVLWADSVMSTERLIAMKPYQRHNHFSGMSEITRKDSLARNLNRMAKLFPTEFDFFPKTWVLPADYGEFQSYSKKKKNKTYICKPDASAQGKGIFLTRSGSAVSVNDKYIVQQYLTKPHLCGGYKYDFRIYVLVLSVAPLRILLHREGLVRFCTEKYVEPTSKNLGSTYQHLTNYSINKHNADFQATDGLSGAKRTLTSFLQELREQGADVDRIWSSISDCIIKTLIVAQPAVAHSYNTFFGQNGATNADAYFQCFEVLGFDVMLDQQLKPWLLEVNHSPSFACDHGVDATVKNAVVTDTLSVLGVRPGDRMAYKAEARAKAAERLVGKRDKKRVEISPEAKAAIMAERDSIEHEHRGGYTRIYPPQDPGALAEYEKLFVNHKSLFKETAATKARRAVALATREKYAAEAARLKDIQNRFGRRADDAKEKRERAGRKTEDTKEKEKAARKLPSDKERKRKDDNASRAPTLRRAASDGLPARGVFLHGSHSGSEGTRQRDGTRHSFRSSGDEDSGDAIDFTMPGTIVDTRSDFMWMQERRAREALIHELRVRDHILAVCASSPNPGLRANLPRTPQHQLQSGPQQGAPPVKMIANMRPAIRQGTRRTSDDAPPDDRDEMRQSASTSKLNPDARRFEPRPHHTDRRYEVPPRFLPEPVFARDTIWTIETEPAARTDVSWTTRVDTTKFPEVQRAIPQRSPSQGNINYRRSYQAEDGAADYDERWRVHSARSQSRNATDRRTFSRAPRGGNGSRRGQRSGRDSVLSVEGFGVDAKASVW